MRALYFSSHVRFLIIGFAALALTATASATELDFDDYWVVAEVRGTVTARIGDNPWSDVQPITAGERIGPHSTIETGPQGEAILVRGGDRMTLYANTAIDLPPVDRSESTSRIFQRLGEALFRVKKSSARPFEVETPFLVAGTRGTSFGVTNTDATSRVHVIEGSVAVNGTGPEPETSIAPTIVNALEAIDSGPGLAPVSSTSQRDEINSWDNRTIEQAVATDRLAQSGPQEVRDVLNRAPAGAEPQVSDVTDITSRLANRQQEVLEKAAADPTPENQAAAEAATAAVEELTNPDQTAAANSETESQSNDANAQNTNSISAETADTVDRESTTNSESASSTGAQRDQTATTPDSVSNDADGTTQSTAGQDTATNRESDSDSTNTNSSNSETQSEETTETGESNSDQTNSNTSETSSQETSSSETSGNDASGDESSGNEESGNDSSESNDSSENSDNDNNGNNGNGNDGNNGNGNGGSNGNGNGGTNENGNNGNADNSNSGNGNGNNGNGNGNGGSNNADVSVEVNVDVSL